MELIRFDNQWSFAFDDEHADSAAAEEILASLFFFSKNFLETITGLSGAFQCVSEMSEVEANNFVRVLVENTCGLDYLIAEAIAWDSRGHFLSRYDGSEVEFKDLEKSMQIDVMAKFPGESHYQMLFYRQ